LATLTDASATIDLGEITAAESPPLRHRPKRRTRENQLILIFIARNYLDPGTDSRVYAYPMADEMVRSSFHSSELSKMAGVSTDTLRHYERKGLLTAKRAQNGYREYSQQALARVNLVQHALSVGFTLDELAKFLNARDQGKIPCREVRALAAEKLEELETRIRSLQLLRNDLRELLKDWDARLERTKDGDRAWLLESLAVGTSSTRKRRKDFGRRKP
jgi:DNA-binding transcriptional MerR regulator